MTRLANGIANCYDCYRTGNDFFGENYDENLVLFWNGSIDDTIGDSQNDCDSVYDWNRVSGSNFGFYDLFLT